MSGPSVVGAGLRLLGLAPRRHRLDWPAGSQGGEILTRFIERLRAYDYSIDVLDSVYPVFDGRHAYLRYDILASATDIEVGLRLASLHQRLSVPGAFHLAWDAIVDHPRLRSAALRLRDFDRAYVRLGLHCDPVSRWIAADRFDGDSGALERFLRSPRFETYLGDLLAEWRAEGADAAPLRALRDGARGHLVELDRSFRQAFGDASSISGRGSPLATSFAKARRASPKLEALARWLHPIDFLLNAELAQLGYAFEATRFAADLGPGPTVLFGGAELPRLREWLETRIAGGGGFLAIFPARYWDDDRYAGLVSENAAPPPTAAATGPAPDRAAPLPDRPFLTNFADLIRFGPRCERVGTRELAIAAREKVGDGIDRSLPRFIAWLRSEGYSFGGFEDGRPRFDARWAYLRYDVHIQDLLAAYVLADLHERLAVVGSFQLMWRFSRYEESVEPYFLKLLEFNRSFVQFGLHVAPAATWYLTEKLGGDYTRQTEAVESAEFVDWLLELRAAYERDREAAPELQRLREGIDDTLSRITASFFENFGTWKSISGHGNFLTNGFTRAAEIHPELRVLRPYFAPVAYLSKFGVARFGFDFEVTAFGADALAYPRLIWETPSAERRRAWFHGRVRHGAGFVALTHPATWSSSHNATFFLSESEARAAEPASPAPGEVTHTLGAPAPAALP